MKPDMNTVPECFTKYNIILFELPEYRIRSRLDLFEKLAKPDAKQQLMLLILC